MPNEDRLAAIEVTTNRILGILTAMWDQQQRARHERPTPEAPAKLGDPRLGEIADAIARRHPKAKSMYAHDALALMLPSLGLMADPLKSAEAINRHHEWRCKYEWAGQDVKFIPKLSKWLEKDAYGPCPSDAEGEAMLRGPDRMSRAERDLLELQQEMER